MSVQLAQLGNYRLFQTPGVLIWIKQLGVINVNWIWRQIRKNSSNFHSKFISWYEELAFQLTHTGLKNLKVGSYCIATGWETWSVLTWKMCLFWLYKFSDVLELRSCRRTALNQHKGMNNSSVQKCWHRDLMAKTGRMPFLPLVLISSEAVEWVPA